MQGTDTQANTGTQQGLARETDLDRGIAKSANANASIGSRQEYADIRNRFTYHPPSDEQVKKYEQLRTAGGNLAMMIADFCPPGREKQLALTQLEQGIMWANASIAREQELKYHDEVVRLPDSKYYTAIRTFPTIGREIRVDVNASDLNLPIGQGLGTDAINRRVLSLAGPQLEQGMTDLKVYLASNPVDQSTVKASIDSPRALATSDGLESGKASLEEDNTSRR